MSSWYANNIVKVVSNAYDSGFGSGSQNYSLGSVFAFTTLFKYWVSAINGGISVYYFFLLIAFLAIFVIKQRLRKKHQDTQTINGPINASLPIMLIWIIVPFIIFSFGVNKDYRFLLPVFPAFGFILARLITHALIRRSQRLVGIPLLIIIPCFMFMYSSLPLLETAKLSLNPFLIFAPDNDWAIRPIQQEWKQEQILLAIEQDASQNGGNVDFPIGIVPNSQYFNALNFMYISINKDLPYQFESFSPPSNDTETDAQLKRLLMMDYVITKTGDQGPIFAYNSELTPQLLEGRLPFIEVARFSLPDNTEAVIFRNVAF